MRIQREIQRKFGLTISLVLFVFEVMIATFVLSGIIAAILHASGILSFPLRQTPVIQNGNPMGGLMILVALCILLGTTLTGFFSKTALKPIRKVIDATHKVAEGDFSVRVDLKGIHELEELSKSFNKMAQDLSSIESLRRDFVNDFSHEFKTPIVSMRGFAKLLKDGDLSEEERQEYLDIIISESERLAQLSTNILNLAKYENIEIVSDKSVFQMDEQIRRAIVLMEPKWAAKNISMDIEIDAVLYEGSEDLTQQIWLNLLDNSIKFSHQNGTIHIRFSKRQGGARFIIQDQGIGMDGDTIARIYDKFYQGDPSHFKSGNGLGLAILKRIVEIHDGSIDVTSAPGQGSTFSIFLPN